MRRRRVGGLCSVLRLRSGAETESRKSKSENADFENSFESKKDTDEVYFESFGVDRKEGCVASLCWVVRLIGTHSSANGPEIAKVGGGKRFFK
jgi:hypothetical protein